jgi:hypothetical protein
MRRVELQKVGLKVEESSLLQQFKLFAATGYKGSIDCNAASAALLFPSCYGIYGGESGAVRKKSGLVFIRIEAERR